MTAQEQIFAFFDVDETLIRTKSMFDFFRFFCERTGALGRLRDFDENFLDMRKRALPREELNRAYYRYYAGLFPGDLQQFGEEWWQEASQRPDILISASVARLLQFKAAGTIPVFVSGSFKEILEPLGRQLGVSNMLCAPMQIGPDGFYTGEIGRLQTIGQGKADAIESFLRKHGASARNCWAVGDDLSDLPMLRAVGHAVVVGLDTPLVEVAHREGWDILEDGLIVA